MMYSWRFEKIPTNKYEVLVKYRNTGDEGILHKHTRVIVEAVDENEARLSAIDAAFVKHPGGEHFTPVEAKELMDEVLP